MDETAPNEIENQENLSVPGVSTELLQEDEDIFKKLNITWPPSELQDITTEKAFD